jgi:hypothetical protein
MEITPPMEKRQCTAKSKQSGVRCKRRPIPGGSVCVMHGGGTAAARAKGEAMLAAAVEPSIRYLLRAARQNKINAVGVSAARDLLDRNGYKPAERQEISGPAGGPVLSQIEIVMVPAVEGRKVDAPLAPPAE